MENCGKGIEYDYPLILRYLPPGVRREIAVRIPYLSRH